MARIRTIKPEFPQSESIGKLSRDARLLFIQLWTISDDEGRARAAPRMLAGLLFPYDNDAPGLIGAWMDELEKVGCIRRYIVKQAAYLDIPGWSDHQKIDKPSKSRLPAFCEKPSEDLQQPAEGSRPLDEQSRIVSLGPRKEGDLGVKGSEANASGAGAPLATGVVAADQTPGVVAVAVKLTEYPLDPTERMWAEGVELLVAMDISDREARSNIGRWLKGCRDPPTVLDAIRHARGQGTRDPIALVSRILNPANKANSKDQVVAAARTIRQQGFILELRPAPLLAEPGSGAGGDPVRRLSDGRSGES